MNAEAPKEPTPAALKLKLNEDLKQALRSGEKVRLTTVRLVISAVRNWEIAKQAEATDTDILAVIGKEVKQRRESIEAFQKGNRQDLVDKEIAEMVILQAYLPQQMGREEIVAEARRVIAEVGAKGPSDKGKVMGKLVAQLKGKADGRDINTVVTELLAQ